MIIKDELYGMIELGDLEERIIDTQEFQRLRRIKQMSVTNLVYPGAHHTRFEHSLGTAHLADLIARRIDLEKEEREKIKLFGLLHDIGHVAFSHEGEDVLAPLIGNHEERGKKIITESSIGDLLKENYSPKEISMMHATQKGMVVEADIGADRMDYLKRDAFNTGVAYGIIDIDRIVHTIEVYEDELCVSEGGLEAAESLLVARFMMFSAVYLHKTVRIATAMLHRAISNAIKDGTLEPEEFALMGDEVAYWRMMESKNAKRYAEGLLKRELFKEVISLPKVMDKEMARKLEEELSERFGCDIIVDYPTTFYKQVELKVRTEDGLRPLTEISSLVRSLRRSEEERRRILILAEEEIRRTKGKEIEKRVKQIIQ